MPELLLVAATERELCPVDGVRAVCCGIGPVEAALTTARALADGTATGVVHVGIAGAPNLAPGTIVIGSESLYTDILDPSATLPRVARTGPTSRLVNAARRALPGAVVATIATTGRVGGGAEYPAEAMEGFGVLRAAALAGVAAVEIRAISNDPSVADRTRWHIADALDALHRATETVIPALLEALEASSRAGLSPPR